jgi:hypothetical protein
VDQLAPVEDDAKDEEDFEVERAVLVGGEGGVL